MKKLLISVAAAVAIVAVSTFYFVVQTGPYEKNSSEYEIVEIPKGAYIGSASQILFEQKLIRSRTFFRLLAKIEGMEDIKAGSYKVQKSSTNERIIEMLNSGETFNDNLSVTIPEGFESYRIAQRLEENGLADGEKFMKLVSKPSRFYEYAPFLKDENVESLEGLLFPDTYYFAKGESEEEIITKMLAKFNEVYGQEYRQKQIETGKSLNEIITMASIIEREAKIDTERSLVASVFYNRLNMNRRLESCATVQYVLKERKANLSREDLEVNSPYNTYRNAGLPPGPIASPGKKSIEAALYPENTNYLYFVAKKDGSHTFSTTYEEHLKAKKKNFSE